MSIKIIEKYEYPFSKLFLPANLPRNIPAIPQVITDFLLNRLLDFFIQGIHFHARIALDDCLLIVNRFERKAIRCKLSLFDVKFKFHPNRDPHAFKAHVQDMIENLFFNDPDHWQNTPI